jgi:hypothetical protein
MLISFGWDGVAGGRRMGFDTMTTAPRANSAHDLASDQEQKQIALTYLHEAWGEARLDGVDGDCLAQAALFTALSELVTTYGEDATAKYADGLSVRIRNGEFSLPLSRQ